MSTCHSSNTTHGEWQRAEDVDERVNKESRVMVQPDFGLVLAHFPMLLSGLSAQVEENGDVKNGGGNQRDEDEQVMGKETKVFVGFIDPTLQDC